MVQYRIDRGAPKRGGRGALVTLIVLAIVILLGARSLASFSIEYQWWKELGQIDTWLAMLAARIQRRSQTNPAAARHATMASHCSGSAKCRST